MTKRLVIIFLMACSISLGATTRVLFIGNSLVYWNDLPATLRNLAASLGETIVSERSSPGGYTLEQHCTNTNTLALIDQGGWDFVVLQEHGGMQFGGPDDAAVLTYPFAKTLSDRIHTGSPDATVLFYMTYAGENPGDLARFDALQHWLEESYDYLAQANNGLVVPVGSAWKHVRHHHPEIGLYSPDGHPSMNGTYLAACAFFDTIYMRTPVGATYTAGIEHSIAATLQNSAATVSAVDIVIPPPAVVTTDTGARIVLSVLASGLGSFSYQWQKDGAALAGATTADFTLASVTPADTGNYTVTIRNSSGRSVVAGPAAVTVSPQVHTPPGSTLVNISTRAQVGTGDKIMIAGFAIGGSGSKKVLIRAVGPALERYGVVGSLVDPKLDLTTLEGTLLASNGDWGSGDPAGLAAAATAVRAFTLSPGSKDAALIITLPEGPYTAQVKGVDDATGIALAEVYDLDPTSAARLVNLSSRAQVGTGDSAMIAGFVVSGAAPRNILVRACGPALARFGVSGVIPDPQLNLTTLSGTSLAVNDNWESPNGGPIVIAGMQVGAFRFTPGSCDSALLIPLSGGSYTPQITDRNGATGLALVEVYELP